MLDETGFLNQGRHSTGAIAVEQFQKSLLPSLEASPLAAFKASRGLSSR